MTTRRTNPLNRLFTLAGFLAVPVIAMMWISVADPDPMIVKALAELAVVYLGWRAATGERSSPAGEGPRTA